MYSDFNDFSRCTNTIYLDGIADQWTSVAFFDVRSDFGAQRPLQRIVNPGESKTVDVVFHAAGVVDFLRELQI